MPPTFYYWDDKLLFGNKDGAENEKVAMNEECCCERVKLVRGLCCCWYEEGQQQTLPQFMKLYVPPNTWGPIPGGNCDGVQDNCDQLFGDVEIELNETEISQSQCTWERLAAEFVCGMGAIPEHIWRIRIIAPEDEADACTLQVDMVLAFGCQGNYCSIERWSVTPFVWPTNTDCRIPEDQKIGVPYWGQPDRPDIPLCEVVNPNTVQVWSSA